MGVLLTELMLGFLINPFHIVFHYVFLLREENN